MIDKGGRYRILGRKKGLTCLEDISRACPSRFKQQGCALHPPFRKVQAVSLDGVDLLSLFKVPQNVSNVDLYLIFSLREVPPGGFEIYERLPVDISLRRPLLG